MKMSKSQLGQSSKSIRDKLIDSKTPNALPRNQLMAQLEPVHHTEYKKALSKPFKANKQYYAPSGLILQGNK